MIKANTIISVHDDRLTLLQWLKAVEKEAEGAKVVKVEFTATADGNAVKITLADGTEIESPRVKAVGALDEFIQHVAEGNITQIVTNAEIKGNLKLDAGIGDFEGKTGLQGDVLTSNGDSIEWKKPSGGLKLYKHSIKLSDKNLITCFSKDPTTWTQSNKIKPNNVLFASFFISPTSVSEESAFSSGNLNIYFATGNVTLSYFNGTSWETLTTLASGTAITDVVSEV